MYKILKVIFHFTLFQALLVCVNHVINDINQSEQVISSRCFGVWCIVITVLYFTLSLTADMMDLLIEGYFKLNYRIKFSVQKLYVFLSHLSMYF